MWIQYTYTFIAIYIENCVFIEKNVFFFYHVALFFQENGWKYVFQAFIGIHTIFSSSKNKNKSDI